jgi:hypothetical protein
MSDETPSSPEISPEPKAASAPRVRRISNPRPKKTAKRAEPADEPAAAEISETPVAQESAPTLPEAPETPADAEWPEPEAATTGGAPAPGEAAKRKRRRRKGKGQGAAQNGVQGSQSAPPVAGDESSQPNPDAPQQRPVQPQQQQAPQQQAPRPKIDPELLTKMAWKIYLAEVSEEGVALIGDNDAKDLSRRCFRLAEIFIEEQQRRR